MNFLFRFFSFLFLAPLSLFFLAVGLFAILDGVSNLNLTFLPWTGKSLNYWLVGLTLFGLISIYLALRKKLRVFYALYGAAVFALAVNGVFLSGHRFAGRDDFHIGVASVAAALAACVGSVMHARK